MPWPVPAPSVIYGRAGASYTAVFPSFDPTQPNTVCGTTSRVIALTAFDLYLYQGYWANELFPDTAQDNLDRHAGIWGLTRIAAQAATGQASGAGSNGTVVPTGAAATDYFGNVYFTAATETVSGSVVTETFQAASGGAQGNLATGTVLTLLSPIAGLSPQSFTVLSPGFSGGAPTETNTALRARLLQRIRSRGRGGNNADFTIWAEGASSLVAYVQVVPNIIGFGSVGLFVAGIGPSALGSGTVAAVNSAVLAVAPVPINETSLVTASATLQTVDGTIHLIPDTPTNRTAATNAFASYIGAAAEIGGTVYLDLIAGAIAAAAAGSFNFDLSAPSADVVVGAGTIAVAGTLGFV